MLPPASVHPTVSRPAGDRLGLAYLVWLLYDRRQMTYRDGCGARDRTDRSATVAHRGHRSAEVDGDRRAGSCGGEGRPGTADVESVAYEASDAAYDRLRKQCQGKGDLATQLDRQMTLPSLRFRMPLDPKGKGLSDLRRCRRCATGAGGDAVVARRKAGAALLSRGAPAGKARSSRVCRRRPGSRGRREPPVLRCGRQPNRLADAGVWAYRRGAPPGAQVTATSALNGETWVRIPPPPWVASTSGPGHLGPQGPVAVAASISGGALTPHARCDGHGYFFNEGPARDPRFEPAKTVSTLISGVRRDQAGTTALPITRSQTPLPGRRRHR